MCYVAGRSVDANLCVPQVVEWVDIQKFGSLDYADYLSSEAEYSFLFESAATTETIGRYSFIGAS